MGFHQYHEPPEELSPATRTFARMITSLTEETEAIGWYEQRISAVSYTHLDVYKRQHFRCLMWL